MQIKERKRFVDSALLNAGWFLKLAPGERLFWVMIQLRCDCIGQFDVEGELIYAERMHGLKINFESLVTSVNDPIERIRDLSKGRFWLVNFIREQYGQLNPKSPPHRRYLKDLEEAGLMDVFYDLHPDLIPASMDSLPEGYSKGSDSLSIGHGKGNDTPEEEEKEQETEKDSDKEKDEESESALSFEKQTMHTRLGYSDEEMKGLPFNK